MRNLVFILCLLGSFSLTAQKGRVSVEQKIFLEGDTISGTLLSPFDLSVSKSIRKTPLLIIIPGSGPTDRNGNLGMVPGNNDSYLQLADSLLAQGLATYRYDKPGVGDSKMSIDESELLFEDNVKFVLAIIEQLKARVGFKHIYLIGHSEGSLIGMLAAQENNSVKGFISIAGPARNAHSILTEQLSNNLPDSSMRVMVIRKLDSVKAGHTVSSPPMLASLFRPSVQPYLKSWFAYTPSEEIKKLRQPVLLLQGGHDLQVPETEAEALAGSQRSATYKFYPEMNHVLKMVDDSMEQNQASYMDEDFRLQINMPQDIANWINAQK